jgi:hypothetical protein
MTIYSIILSCIYRQCKFKRKNAKIPPQCKFKRKNANIKGKTLKCHNNANLKGKMLKCHNNANIKGKTLKCHDNVNLKGKTLKYKRNETSQFITEYIFQDYEIRHRHSSGNLYLYIFNYNIFRSFVHFF